MLTNGELAEDSTITVRTSPGGFCGAELQVGLAESMEGNAKEGPGRMIAEQQVGRCGGEGLGKEFYAT